VGVADEPVDRALEGAVDGTGAGGRRLLVSEAALIVGMVAFEAVLVAHTSSMGWSPIVLVLRVPVAVLVLVLRRRWPLLALALAGSEVALQGQLSAALPVAAYALTRYDGRWLVRVPALTVASGITVWSAADRWGVHTAVVFAGSFVLWPATLGAYVPARAALVAVLTERAQRAESDRDAAARAAVQDERVRIAGEMHDVVGHRVSLMVLHAGAVEMAAADPSKVTQLAEQMQAAGRQALQELRQLVGLLRADEPLDAPLTPQPTLADLPALLEESRSAGMAVTLDPLGRPRPLSALVDRTAYRVVQEALTNAGRHAPGGAVAVTLAYDQTHLTVRVVNGRGTSRPTTVAGHGHGLIGLRERAHAVGGQLRANPVLDGGFSIEAVLPT
jgi:signal transduction histidine kinase